MSPSEASGDPLSAPAERTPEFLFFDLGNVLLHFDHEIACRNLAQLAGIPRQRVQEVLFESGLELRYERGELTTAAFHEAFCRNTATRVPLAPLLEAASQIFEANGPVLELAQRLQQRGWSLGILSNTCAAHWEHIVDAFPTVGRTFAVHVLSFEVLSLKPEPEIYEAAQQRAGVAAEALFFVDDRAENVAAARAAGWDAVPYVSAAQLEQDLARRRLL